MAHLKVSERGALFVGVWVGTREGGAFEASRVVVAEIDEAQANRSTSASRSRVDGRPAVELFELDDLRARARFEELRPEEVNEGSSRGLMP